MNIDLQAIGMTEEKLQEQVINAIANRLLSSFSVDEDGNGSYHNSHFANKLNEMVKERIDQAVNDLADKHILPNVKTYLENLSLQTTNRWGEPKADPMTFLEYLVSRADAYMNEKLSFDGKTKNEDSYNWKGTQTRISYMVHQHLHFTLDSIMKNAMANANAVLVQGIQETCKIKLQEIAASLKVKVEAK